MDLHAKSKKDTLVVSLLTLWLASVLFLLPRILALLVGPEHILAKGVVIAFSTCLALIWLYVFYHLVHFVCSTLAQKTMDKNKTGSDAREPVALLYMTCNDFQAKYLDTCLGQDYPDFQVFVCDDSSRDDFKSEIDAYARTYPKQVTVLRRANRDGFKAGNINHALEKIEKRFTRVFIADADSGLPSDLLDHLASELEEDEKLAFVQAGQREAPEQPSTFARIMGFNTNLHWQHYMPAKNRYGFVMFYGHAALMRRSAIEAIGGMPEVATEDLAFSMLCRKSGFYGKVSQAAVSTEEFPKDLIGFRRRNRKWVKGTLECLLNYLPGFLKAKNISWVEKIDLLVSSGSLLQALPFMAFLFLVGLCLPVYYADLFSYGPMHYLPPLAPERWIERLLRMKYWKIDFFSMMMAAIFVPSLPVLLRLRKEPGRMVAYLFVSAFTYLSTMIDTAKEALAYLWSRKTEFFPTADTSLKTEKPFGLAIEGLLGLGFLILAFSFSNVWILAAAAAFILSPIAISFGTENRFIRYATYTPFAICLYMGALIGASIL